MPFDSTDFVPESKNVTALRKARQKVAAGWCQHALSRFPDDGRHVEYCAVGALLYAEPAFLWDSPLRYLWLAIFDASKYAEIRDVLRPRIDIERWNDSKWRSQAEVLAAYDRAISLALAEETIYAV